ncbi:ParB/RepB/Spo0J family partition protein [Clostridium sp. CX1]|uniref:ParB/RepB/Spo0J family partition protein n=1 Tax=Clostridium sp. CX1 TaxID=2978346 RepID=UPI0021BE7545|nr:ParB/RepB/Spo0J family partition protein [Clostridium sp. CX1]MCT8974989.1 ParB/RepB/Spo0J family partition protein [Clostridium sp. CX1]
MFKKRNFKVSDETIRIKDIIAGERTHKNQQIILSLMESIEANGLINPVTVERTADGVINLIAGYHRTCAYKGLGYTEIPARVIAYNKDVTKVERELTNAILKGEEDIIRKVLTPYQLAKEIIALEDAYIKKYPDYKIDPQKYIEIYKQKIEARDRARLQAKAAETKSDKEMFEKIAHNAQLDVEKFVPPMEKLIGTNNLTPKKVELVEKLADLEKKNRGIINVLEQDKVSQTQLTRVVDKLSTPEVADDYNNYNSQDRKQLLRELETQSKIENIDMPNVKVNDGIIEIGKNKIHCIARHDMLHLVQENKYNMKFHVTSEKQFDSVIKAMTLEHFTGLMVFFDDECFRVFADNLK